MAPFIPDGVYKIHNVQYSDVVVDLINAVRDGPIQGYIDRPTNTNDKWKITNVGDGGNQVTFESVSVPGNFASAPGVDANLVGGNDVVWTIIKVDVGYYISSGSYYVWQLTQGGDYGPIVTSLFTDQANTKWTFERIDN